MNNECKCKGFYQPVSCPIHGNRPKAEPPDAVLEVFDSVKQYEATKSAIRSIQKCPCKVQCGHPVERHKLITESGRGVTVCLDCEPKASPSLEDAAPVLERYGIRWKSQTEPISEPMADGYWTPWHLAEEAIRQQRRDAVAEFVRRLRNRLTDAFACGDSIEAVAKEMDDETA